VFRYTREWEELTKRLGFWVNLDEAYVTFHQSYVESVWWGLKTLFERGLLYQGHKVVWWWAQGGTALSAGEVGEGYRTVDDPSVFVKFPLVGHEHAQVPVHMEDQPISLLVWTTTPWTLISNHFAAVHPELEYALVRDPELDEYLYIAKDLVEAIGNKVKRELEIVSTYKGADLIGLRYQPPFPNLYYTSMGERGRRR
jgi:isoleucyl-tRNA synthetase